MSSSDRVDSSPVVMRFHTSSAAFVSRNSAKYQLSASSTCEAAVRPVLAQIALRRSATNGGRSRMKDWFIGVTCTWITQRRACRQGAHSPSLATQHSRRLSRRARPDLLIWRERASPALRTGVPWLRCATSIDVCCRDTVCCAIVTGMRAAVALSPCPPCSNRCRNGSVPYVFRSSLDYRTSISKSVCSLALLSHAGALFCEPAARRMTSRPR